MILNNYQKKRRRSNSFVEFLKLKERKEKNREKN